MQRDIADLLTHRTRDSDVHLIAVTFQCVADKTLLFSLDLLHTLICVSKCTQTVLYVLSFAKCNFYSDI